MKNSFIISSFFLVGSLIGRALLLPLLASPHLTEFVLYFLVFFVGLSLGNDKHIRKSIKHIHLKIVLVPLCAVIGSFLGVIVVSPFLKTLSLKDALAVGSGLGYYSLSSFIITKFHNETVGTVALLSNLIRELVTLVLSPFLVKYFGKLAPIVSGGVTSMDTALPIISRSVGKEYTIISIFSGVALTIIVPFLIIFIVKH